jgi:hypothetical protein
MNILKKIWAKTSEYILEALYSAVLRWLLFTQDLEKFWEYNIHRG